MANGNVKRMSTSRSNASSVSGSMFSLYTYVDEKKPSLKLVQSMSTRGEPNHFFSPIA